MPLFIVTQLIPKNFSHFQKIIILCLLTIITFFYEMLFLMAECSRDKDYDGTGNLAVMSFFTGCTIKKFLSASFSKAPDMYVEII